MLTLDERDHQNDYNSCCEEYENMAKCHDSPSNIKARHFSQNLKYQPHGVGRGKVRGSPNSLGYII